MDNSSGLILEGGAMRSVFSAGILDFLMEKGIDIPNMIAVSAGAYLGMNYVSGQRERCLETLIKPLKQYKFLGVGTFFRKGTFFDMDYLFDAVLKEKAPFDFETFRKSTKRFVTSTVDCETGKLIYHEEFKTEDEFYNVCRAANSLPPVVGITYVKDRPMLDGGLADAIPIAKALEEGWKKIVVILTRDASYRKKDKLSIDMKINKILYRKYPRLLELIDKRATTYNQSVDLIEELEREGRAFVFRPTQITVKNGESNVEKLLAYYQHGYDTAKRRYHELLDFLTGKTEEKTDGKRNSAISIGGGSKT